MRTQPNGKTPAIQEREVRSIKQQKFEVRANTDGTRTVEGHFAVFNSPSVDMGFREIIRPGAFSRSLKENPDVLALYGHDYGSLLGRVSSGTLRLREDEVGLRFSLDLPPSPTGTEVGILMERGDLSACSFGFATIDDDWEQVGGEIVRTLNEVLLFEGSIVSQPAYPATKASLRRAPAEIRAKLQGTKRDVDESDVKDSDGCACDGSACVSDGDCEACTSTACDDGTCRAAGCPVQGRALLSRRGALLQRRLSA